MTNSSTKYMNIWLHRFAKLVVGATFFLIFVGGLVTSTESGLAVPDWPTTYGYFMFSFPLSEMVGGILYEHGHRMAATIVGFLTMVLAIWLWIKEPRKWVRWFGLSAIFAVIIQGILGGLTVLFLLPTIISVSHATLAQTFFCMTICIALFTSPKWQQESTKTYDPHSPSLKNLTVATTVAIYVQLILGALMRHTKSGLAIPDFPLAFGGIIPPFTSPQVMIHFAHRVGALFVTILLLWTVVRIIRFHSSQKILLHPAIFMGCAIFIQLTLGALTIWTHKAIIPTTAHVANGAFILGTSLVLALRTYVLIHKPDRLHSNTDNHLTETNAEQLSAI